MNLPLSVWPQPFRYCGDFTPAAVLLRTVEQ